MAAAYVAKSWDVGGIRCTVVIADLSTHQLRQNPRHRACREVVREVVAKDAAAVCQAIGMPARGGVQHDASRFERGSGQNDDFRESLFILLSDSVKIAHAFGAAFIIHEHMSHHRVGSQGQSAGSHRVGKCHGGCRKESADIAAVPATPTTDPELRLAWAISSP